VNKHVDYTNSEKSLIDLLKMKEEKTSDGNETVYFVAEEPFCEMVKIGKTTRNIGERLSGLQTGNPRKLSCLASFERPKKYNYENMFHKLFSGKHIRGEWFNLSVNLIEKIKLTMAGNDFDEEILRLNEEFSQMANLTSLDSNIQILVGNIEKPSRKKKSNKHHMNTEDESLYDLRKNIDKKRKNSGGTVKYDLLKYYGLQSDEDIWKLFDSAENVEKYSDKRVMKFYKEMAYRDLPIEFVKKIDAEGTVNMNDDEKQTYRYLAGKHTIINKIREIFKDGFVEYPTILEYVKSLHKIKIPQFARYKAPTNKSVMSMVDKLIRPYGLKAFSKRVGKGANKKQLMSIIDISVELFEIKVLPYNSNNDVRNNTLQSGQTDKPVVIVYSC
jgi:hypothetical protein